MDSLDGAALAGIGRRPVCKEIGWMRNARVSQARLATPKVLRRREGRGSRHGWYAGIVFTVFMLIPIGWDATLAPLNVVYGVVSIGAFAVVLVALWRERTWFKHRSLDPARHPV